ncbi:MAG: rod-binding protein [Desulfosarcina sp.]|nr:rod-binding protein [Desulfobacterales bacterium]
MPLIVTSDPLPDKGHQPSSGLRPERGLAVNGRKNDPDREQMRLKQACADFEALLIQKLFQTMRASIPKSGLIDSGPAEEIYTGMLDQQVAQDLALQGGLGLSAQIKEQIVRYMDKLKVEDD